MKRISTWCAMALAVLGISIAARAATDSEDSPPVWLDTRDSLPTVTVTMRRARAAVLENIGPGSGIDEELRVKGTDRAALAQQPALPGQMDPSIFNFVVAQGGLVADGVTPLIFQVDAAGSLPVLGTKYVVTLKPVRTGLVSGGFGAYSGDLDSRVQVLSGSSFVSGTTITATPQQPQAFVVLRPINPEHLTTTTGGANPVHTPLVVDLEVREEATTRKVATFRFGLRKPPLVLVHGYNADETTWEPEFKMPLARDRGNDFVRPIPYGTGSDASGQINTFHPLRELIGVLDRELSLQVAINGVSGPWASNWAFTRYDVIGHSQGGVLARLLCSSPPASGTPSFVPFKGPGNLHRGRFRRVVTIGSPHVGSTMCELALKLNAGGVSWGALRAQVGELIGRFEPKEVFQEKFKVGNGSELAGLNLDLPCHQDARLHLLWTTVDGGQAPGHPGIDHLFYKALYLDRTTPEIEMLRPGQVVAPNGADAVVSTDSQGKDWPAPNRSSTVAGSFCHAVWGVTQTQADAVATRALTLLNSPESASEFGQVVIPASVTVAMETARGRIATLAPLLLAEYHRQEPTLPLFRNAVMSAAGKLPPGKVAGFGPGEETLDFILEPVVDETVAGPATWLAESYGPTGVTSAGLTLVTSGTNAEQLVLTVAASVQGTVVLRVSYLSATGKTVFGQPSVVLTRAPGAAITGIEVRPVAPAGAHGTSVPLEVWAIYDGATASRVYVTAANTVFTTSNAAVASVDAAGVASLLLPGAATITASYQNQWSAQRTVTVLDDPPVVVNPPAITGEVGQYLSWQLSTSQPVLSFAMDALPPGLTLDAPSGFIEGVPTSAGRFAAVVTVENANGRSSKQMEFVIAGVAGAPTDVGLDAAGVNGGKPVGTLVGRLTTTDPNPLDTFTYALVSGVGSTQNALFTIAGDALVTAAVLDGAVTSTVSLRVRTTDASGASFAKALVLPVGTPPAITRQPDARTVFAGESATFFVDAIGLEPRLYQWMKGGVNVSGATSRVFEVPATALTDAGSYTVTVSNGDGSVTSAAVSLVVNPISYGRWASALPSGMASALFEPGADFNADGIVNFLDFAFGVEPGLESGVGAQPSVSRDALGYVFTYREANGVSPLTYRILKSVNLGAWVEQVPGVGEVTRTNLGTHTVVAVRVPAPNPGVFLKVEVSGP